MQIIQPGGKICKWCHLVAKVANSSSGAIWWPNLQLMQVVVAKFSPSLGVNFWVVVPLAMFFFHLAILGISAQLCTFNQVASLHCHIALNCRPYWHNQLVLSWHLHQPESHQLSFNKVSDVVTDIRTQRSDPRFTWVR